MTRLHRRSACWAALIALLLTGLSAAVTHADGPTTKLGIGLYRESHQARDAIFQMRPPAVLLQDPSGKLPGEIKAKLSRTLVIGRYSVEDTITIEGATRYADTIASKYKDLKGAIDAWTFYNEPMVQGPGQAEMFDAAQAAFAQRMHQHGWKVVGFNFGVGVLEPGDYPRLFSRSLPLVDYIGVHAYGSERDFFMSGPDKDYYALRYRRIRAAILAAGYDKPFLLTETGTWSGWQGKVPVDDVVRDYLWLEGEIARDDYVLAQIPFALDGFDWDSFKLLDSSAVGTFSGHNQGKSPVSYATRTPTPAATSTPLAPTPPPILSSDALMAAARPHIGWLREVAKLPAGVRAQAVQAAARELGISVLTVYEWLTWLEANGELGSLVVTPTPLAAATPAPEAAERPIYQIYLPEVAMRAEPPTPTPTPTPTPRPTPEPQRGGLQ